MANYYDKNTKFSIEEHTGDVPVTDRHFHDLIEFYYLQKGEASYFIDDKTFLIEKGDLLVIPPNTIHKTISVNNIKRRRCLIYLDKDFVKEILPYDISILENVSFFHISENDRISAIISDLVQEFSKEKNEYLMRALICEFLILLSRKETLNFSLPERKVLSNKITDIISYVNINFVENITLNDISEKFFINSSYLSRIFKKHTGFNFNTYLNKYRITKAIELLNTSDKNITEVALATGFNSLNNFCKTFKSAMGVSPLEFRKMKIHNSK